MAHAYVSSYKNFDDLKITNLTDCKTGESRAFASIALEYLDRIASMIKILPEQTNKGELASFISYAIAFPTNFLVLVDTYDVLKSGVPNFLAVTCALHECSYQAIGLRLDSGDLAYLSLEIRSIFDQISQALNISFIKNLIITASNDINEDILRSLEKQEHSIDAFGIGTHLVTCQKQPALGCVYKLVQLNGSPCLKISQDIEKVSIPGQKTVYRLYGRDGRPLCDLMTKSDEEPPREGEKILCRHPFIERKRAYVTPSMVKPMHQVYWENGQINEPLPAWEHVRNYAQEQILSLRKDHRRYLNPTPYKVSVSEQLFTFMHQLWMNSVPIGELS